MKQSGGIQMRLLEAHVMSICNKGIHFDVKMNSTTTYVRCLNFNKFIFLKSKYSLLRL